LFYIEHEHGTWYKISTGIYEKDTKMDREEKVNDVVQKNGRKKTKNTRKKTV
jgi:hypothetical protein